MQELQVEPMTEKNHTQTALTVFLVSLLVIGAFAPFTVGIAAGSQSNSSNDFCEDYSTAYEAFAAEDCVDKLTQEHSQTANLGGLYTEITKENFFSTSHTTGGEQTYTQWAAYGDTAFRYAHYAEQDEDGDTEHTWKVQVVQFNDKNNNGEIDSGELSGIHAGDLQTDDKVSSLDQTSFELGHGQKAVVKRIDTHDSDTEGETTEADASFLKTIMEAEGINPSNFDASSSDTTTDTEDNLQQILEGATDSKSSTSGSVVDYNLKNHQPVSVYVSRFKDSSTADEPFEYRSMPPAEGQAAGDVSDFQKMMGEDGKATISGGDDGLYAGFGIFRVPDSQTGTATLVIESAGGNGHGNSDATVRIVDRNGNVFKSTELKRSITLPSEAVKYANNNNAVYVIIDGNEDSKVSVSCISVVTNTDSAQSCDAGEVKTTAPSLGQSDDTSTDSTTDTATSDDESTSGDILDYDISKTTYSESIDYTSGFADGDSQSNEYFETSIPMKGDPAGDVQNYPRVMDSNPATAATFSAGSSGLNAALSADGIPLGENHIFVMTYKVTNGEAPTVYLHTPNGERVRVPQSKLSAGEINTVAVSVPTELSKSMNRYGSAYFTISSSKSTTELKVYCASFIANPQSTDNIKCSGTSNSGGTSVQSLSTSVKTANTKPTAKLNTPETLEEGETSTFSAEKVPDAQTYSWKITSDKLAGPITSTGRTIDAKFVESGEYTVELTVKDTAGNTDTKTKTVSVGKAKTTLYKWEKVIPKTKTKVASEKPGEKWTKGSLVRTDDAVTFTRKIFQKNHYHGHDHDKQGRWSYQKKHIHEETHWHSESTGWQNMENGGADYPNGAVRNVDRDVTGHDHDTRQVWHGTHEYGHDHDTWTHQHGGGWEKDCSWESNGWWGGSWDCDWTYDSGWDHTHGHNHDINYEYHGSHTRGHDHDRKERYTYEDKHIHQNTHWHNAETSWSNLEENGMPDKPSGSDIRSVSKDVKGHDHDKSLHKHYDRKEVTKELDDSSVSKHMHSDSTGWQRVEAGGANKPSGSDIMNINRDVTGHDHDTSNHWHDGYYTYDTERNYDCSWESSGWWGGYWDCGWETTTTSTWHSGYNHQHGHDHDKKERYTWETKHWHGLPDDTLMNTVEETSVNYYKYSKDYTVTESKKKLSAPSSYDDVKNGKAGVTTTTVKCDTLSTSRQESASECTVDSKESSTNTDGDGTESYGLSHDELRGSMATDHGMQYSEQGNYLKFSEKANDGGFTAAMKAPSNNGEVTVDIGFEASSFEGSGVMVYAVDVEGDTKVIKCDSGVNSQKLPDLNCDEGDKGSSFSWSGGETVSMDAEIDEVVVVVDMENVLGKYYDTGKFYYLKVTEDSQER